MCDNRRVGALIGGLVQEPDGASVFEDGCWRQPFPVWLAEAGYYDAVGGKEMQFPNLRIMCKDGTMAGLMPRELK